LLLALALQGLRRLADWRGVPHLGRWASRAIVAGAVVTFVAALMEWQPFAHKWPWCLERARMQTELEAEPGRHLAIVRYTPSHSIHQEWVYNRADIDAAKVVWARDLGDERNQRLLDYFADRRVWIVEPDHVEGVRRSLLARR